MHSALKHLLHTAQQMRAFILKYLSWSTGDTVLSCHCVRPGRFKWQEANRLSPSDCTPGLQQHLLSKR